MKKDQARERARELHAKLLSKKNNSWEEHIEFVREVMKIGKRAGLLREFRENGLI
jgi:hypothetical protein